MSPSDELRDSAVSEGRLPGPERRRLERIERLERLATELLQTAAILKAEIASLRAGEKGDGGPEGETISSIPDWP